MSKTAYSKDRFYEFLEYISSERLVIEVDLDHWEAAATQMLAVLTPAEEKDLRSLDVDVICRRFTKTVAQRGNSITPWVLHQYKRQLRDAIGNFVAFAINPTKYTTSMQHALDSKQTEFDEHHGGYNKEVAVQPPIWQTDDQKKPELISG